jgi:hypothetical protein
VARHLRPRPDRPPDRGRPAAPCARTVLVRFARPFGAASCPSRCPIRAHPHVLAPRRISHCPATMHRSVTGSWRFPRRSSPRSWGSPRWRRSCPGRARPRRPARSPRSLWWRSDDPNEMVDTDNLISLLRLLWCSEHAVPTDDGRQVVVGRPAAPGARLDAVDGTIGRTDGCSEAGELEAATGQAPLWSERPGRIRLSVYESDSQLGWPMIGDSPVCLSLVQHQLVATS